MWANCHKFFRVLTIGQFVQQKPYITRLLTVIFTSKLKVLKKQESFNLAQTIHAPILPMSLLLFVKQYDLFKNTAKAIIAATRQNNIVHTCH